MSARELFSRTLAVQFLAYFSYYYVSIYIHCRFSTSFPTHAVQSYRHLPCHKAALHHVLRMFNAALLHCHVAAKHYVLSIYSVRTWQNPRSVHC